MSRSLAVGNDIQGSDRLWAICVWDPCVLWKAEMIDLIWPTRSCGMVVSFLFKEHPPQGGCGMVVSFPFKEHPPQDGCGMAVSSPLRNILQKLKIQLKKMLFSPKDFENIILSARMLLCLSAYGKPLQRPQKGQHCLCSMQWAATIGCHTWLHVCLLSKRLCPKMYFSFEGLSEY